MRHFLSLLKRFHSDERGAFLVIFGVLAIVLIATSGAVVDYATIEQTRTRAQDALDSAALGLQPTIFETGVTEDTIKPQAQALLDERLAGENVTATLETVTINKSEGTLLLQANVVIPTSFVALVGVPSVTAGVVSEATRKRLKVEVAMVLDNSGSMNSSSRMTNLKAAAKCATGVLLNGDCNSTATTASVNTVKIGIVPFTSFVNVGTGYASAAWMDKGNGADYANDNFDDDDNDATTFAGAVNRFALYDALSNVSWQGCVEARKYPYDTNDTTPDASSPDTLFVPEFAPDNPDGWGYSNSYLDDEPAACSTTTLKGACERKDATTYCNSSGSYCYGGTTTTYKLTAPNGTVTTGSSVCSCSGETILSDSTAITGSGWGYSYTKTRTRTCNDYSTTAPTGLSDRELQERLCKYTGAIDTGWGKGPNQDCPTNPMTPLTNTKATITAAIDAMYPQGYTNIHQGAIWGFHMLSPTEPLTEADAYTTGTYKVMIIMTDGENTYNGWDTGDMNGGDGYWAYGYPWNNPGGATAGDNKRMRSTTYPNPSTESQLIASQNTRTVETCTNAKAAGITIYTIGLNSPNTTTTQMLKDCATSVSNAYFPTASSELITVFEDIASQLSKLRLAK